MATTTQEQEDRLYEEQAVDKEATKEKASDPIKAMDFKRYGSMGEVFGVAEEFTQKEETNITKYFMKIKDEAMAQMDKGHYYNPDHPAGSISLDIKTSPAILYKTDKDLQFARKSSMAEVLNPVAHLRGGNANKVELFRIPNPSEVKLKIEKDGGGYIPARPDDYKAIAAAVTQELNEKAEKEPWKENEIKKLIETHDKRIEKIKESGIPEEELKKKLNAANKEFSQNGAVILLHKAHSNEELLNSKGERAEIVQKHGTIGGKFRAEMGYEFGMSVNGKVISLSKEEKDELKEISKKTGESIQKLEGAALTRKFERATAEVDRVGPEHAPSRKEAVIQSVTSESAKAIKWRATFSATQGVINTAGKAISVEKRNDQAMRSTLAQLFSQIMHSLGAGTRGLSR